MENTELSDGDLREISQRLGSEWKKPARCLGFNPREISSYMSSPAETENATFGILKKWRKRLPSDIDQSRHLGQALKKIGRHDLASVLNIQRDSYKSEASDVDKPSEGGMTTCHVCRQFQEKEGSGERTEDTELSDVALYEVSQRLGPEWKMLALHLGFNRREISDMSSPGQMENRIFDMLIKWLEQQPSTHDQSRNLCHALNKIGRPDLAALLNSWQGSLVNLLERSLDMLALWWKKQENPKDAGRTLLHTFKERRLTYLISEIQELAVISVLEAISKHHLKCSVCAERFQEPMALECLHSFCKRCLQGLSKDKSCTEISCPECRQKTRLPAAGVEGLKVNFRLNNVVEEIKKQEKLTASETSNEESDDSERQTSAASHPSSDSQEESRLGENSKDAKHKKECWQTLDQQELKCVSGEGLVSTSSTSVCRCCLSCQCVLLSCLMSRVLCFLSSLNYCSCK